MLDEILLGNELYKLSLNFSVDMKEGYTAYMITCLNQYGFTDDEFMESVEGIKRNETSLFARMPNIGMFLKYRPVRKRKHEIFRALPIPKLPEGEKERRVEMLDKLAKKLKTIGRGTK